METFVYSEEFRRSIVHLHRGKETWPNYQKYIEHHLGGPHSRLATFSRRLCPEITYHCGSLVGKRVLDFGCGTGATTVALARLANVAGEPASQLLAFDVDRESVAICQQRLREHGLADRVTVYWADDLSAIEADLGTFDLILMNGVIEHIPLSRPGLRRGIVRSLFAHLNRSGYLFINDTPNRLWPFDFHSTQLWCLPWTRPGSTWAYKRAVAKGRHSDVPTIDPGPLGLEEVGAWGATYREISGYLQGEPFVCVNLSPGHDRHVSYAFQGGWKRRLFESFLYYTAVKWLRMPITAFAPSLDNLVFQRV